MMTVGHGIDMEKIWNEKVDRLTEKARKQYMSTGKMDARIIDKMVLCTEAAKRVSNA